MKYNVIIKPERFDKFTIIPNYILRDKGISVGATGLYAWLFSHDSKQKINIEFIIGHFKENKSAIRSKLNELIDKGYLVRKRVYENGKIKGINYILHDNPLKSENLMTENLELENQPQSNTNINNNTYIESNISYKKIETKIYPHFVELFPTNFQPKSKNQKDKWIDCLDKIERIEKIKLSDLYLVVKHIRRDSFWNEHFLTLLKLRNKDKNGIKYLYRFLQIYKSANKPKSYYKIKGIKNYAIHVENGKEVLVAVTQNGVLNNFNLKQVLTDYEIKEILNWKKNA